MPIALLKTNFSKSAIDRENGIISGVRVMEIGKLAQFNTVGAGIRKVTLTARHIDALMSHAGNRSVTMHLTHDWLDAKSDKDTVEMKSRIGALKNFRKDESGNLIADAYLMNGEHRESIMFDAEENPDNCMISAVYSFAKDDPDCLPTNFKAADLVSQGAGTTALLSEAEENENTMDKKELLEMLKDPEVVASLSAIIVVKPETDTAALKVLVDEGVTAALKAHKVVLTEDQTTEIAKLAEAKVVAGIGANPGLRDLFVAKKDDGDVEKYITAQLAAGCAGRGAAIARMSHDKPELYNTAVKEGKI
jgi:azurin